MTQSKMYKRHRFAPEIIQYAVWLYHRFNLNRLPKSEWAFNLASNCYFYCAFPTNRTSAEHFLIAARLLLALFYIRSGNENTAVFLSRSKIIFAEFCGNTENSTAHLLALSA